MTITLQDPMLLRDPASRHAFPEMGHEQRQRRREPMTLAEEILARFARGQEALGGRHGVARCA